jgi:hypothetical protein
MSLPEFLSKRSPIARCSNAYVTKSPLLQSSDVYHQMIGSDAQRLARIAAGIETQRAASCTAHMRF